MRSSLIRLSESAHGGEGVNPYVVGAGTLALLLLLLLVVLAVGAGRDHT